MTPPAFEIVAGYAPATALLGANPTRFWPFGHAPQNETRPYAVWQTVYGNPYNSLSCIPSEDLYGVQVDAYAKTGADARKVAAALRDAFELSYNQVTAWNGEDWEPATGLYRVSMTVEFVTER